MSLKTIGNIASNQIYNPDERRHPPPTSSVSSERDSEMEKYIRKKYELGAFKAGASASGKALEPTSMNRYRQHNQAQKQSDRAGDRDAAGPAGRSKISMANASGARDMGPWDRTQENRRNPELNDLVIKLEKKKAEERDLPPLPISASSTGAARERPKPTVSPAPQSTGLGVPPQRVQPSQPQQPQLIDFNSLSSNSTLPLQQHLSPMSFTSPSGSLGSLGSPGNTTQGQGYGGYLSNSAPAFSPNQQAAGTSYFQANSMNPSPSHSFQSSSYSQFNPFLQQQQQQQQQQPNGSFQHAQGQQMSPNGGMHHSNPFFTSPSADPNLSRSLSPGYTAQMAVQQAMAGPQQQIFPSAQSQAQSQSQGMGMGMGMGMGVGMGMGMNQQAQGQAQGQGQGWGYNPQQQQQHQQQAYQQNMGWVNGPSMGYTFAQGQ